MLLVCTVVGQRHRRADAQPRRRRLQLLENALITGAVLVALILALGPVSAAFNPVVTLAERRSGAITTAQAAVFIAAQVLGRLPRAACWPTSCSSSTRWTSAPRSGPRRRCG
jgi:glycerol uptake facilitator-like aquaporin